MRKKLKGQIFFEFLFFENEAEILYLILKKLHNHSIKKNNSF